MRIEPRNSAWSSRQFPISQSAHLPTIIWKTARIKSCIVTAIPIDEIVAPEISFKRKTAKIGFIKPKLLRIKKSDNVSMRRTLFILF
jgi:hypothetical protein